MIYTDEELEALLGDIESDLAERKETFKGDAPEKVREAVCAFANDLPGYNKPGVVFIGARDNGTPSGVPITDQLLLILSDIRFDGNILPPPPMTVQKRTLRGAEMAVITVLPSDTPPVRIKGRIWVRVGPRRGIASAQEERVLNEKRRFRDRTFDSHPISSADVAQLDELVFMREYLPSAFSPDVLEANGRTYEQRLAATKMVVSAEEPTPTVAGLLVLGIRTRDFIPGAYVEFLRFDGTALTDPILDSAEIDGTISQVIRRTEEKLTAVNQTAVSIGPMEKRASLYPDTALQQLVRNAILHRNYEGTSAPIRIYWFEDRLEIRNPGGPYGAVTKETFGDPGVTDYRNPVLAEALKVLGFVNRFGVGIATARKALLENGNPEPEFEVQPQWVTVILRPRTS
ncbi:ATP-binding protein [Armatimonas sp.]|uniref:ATP-binding protein n=1 Tax=Armatimonas sp. TaxID=1872638 RepID=UPI00375111E1